MMKILFVLIVIIRTNRKDNKMKKYTLKEIKKLWHFAYNEDLAKEYKGFFNLLKKQYKKGR